MESIDGKLSYSARYGAWKNESSSKGESLCWAFLIAAIFFFGAGVAIHFIKAPISDVGTMHTIVAGISR